VLAVLAFLTKYKQIIEPIIMGVNADSARGIKLGFDDARFALLGYPDSNAGTSIPAGAVNSGGFVLPNAKMYGIIDQKDKG
jgi:hypothetical protein